MKPKMKRMLVGHGVLLSASLALAPGLAGCATGGGGGGGPQQDGVVNDNEESTPPFTVAETSFPADIEASAARFEVRTNGERARNRVEISLFRDRPTDEPSRGEVTLSPEGVEIDAPGGGGSEGLDGSGTILVSVADQSVDDAFAEGLEVGAFRFRVDEGEVTIENPAIELSAEALRLVLQGAFSVGLEVTADIDIDVTINQLMFGFGPVIPVTGDGSDDNANTADEQNDNGEGPVPAVPSIALSVTSLTFTAIKDSGGPVDQTILLTNTGDGTLNWSVAADAAWLSVEPSNGSITTEAVDLVVSVSPAALDAQVAPYAAQITVTADGADNSPQTVEVTLTVTSLEDCQPLGGSVSEDLTLVAGCYLAGSNVSIGGNATLTIEPGVTIVFQQDARLTVGADACLSAVGTAEQPIVLTGAEAIRGYWDAVYFNASNDFQNRLDHVTIEYAGSALTGSLYLGGGVRLDITDCTLREGAHYGLYMDQHVEIGEFAGNALTANADGAAAVHAHSVGFLDETSTYAGNDRDVVQLFGSSVDRDQTWPAIDVDYVVASKPTVNALLTISPGVRLIFQQDMGLTIGPDGELSAAGTADRPIVMTGEEQIRGFWDGVLFNQTNTFGNTLDYVTIEYAGAGYSANLWLNGGSSSPVRVAITNCTLREGGQYGLYTNQYVEIEEFQRNMVTANALGAASLNVDTTGYLDDTSSYSGNDVDVVVLRGSLVVRDQTWPGIDADYLVSSYYNVDARLVIAPGARLVFQQDTGMTIRTTGRLTAVGTAAQPILFTGEEARAGFWAGFGFNDSDFIENGLEWVTVEYGGGGGAGNLWVSGSSLAEVTNCTFQHSSTWGVWVGSNATVNEGIEHVETANTFANNAEGNVYTQP